MNRTLSPILFQTLSLFSAETGLTDEAAFGMLDRGLKDPNQMLRLKSELQQLLADPSFSWLQALDNGHDLTVFPAETEDEARTYVIELLWARYFPNDAIPSLGS